MVKLEDATGDSTRKEDAKLVTAKVSRCNRRFKGRFQEDSREDGLSATAKLEDGTEALAGFWMGDSMDDLTGDLTGVSSSEEV
jgi:hypothetical protein